MEYDTDKPELEILAKAAELRELLKQRPDLSPEMLELEEALARLERLQPDQ